MNRCIDAENILLTDVPNKLLEARKLAKDVPYELYDFVDYLASIAKVQLNPAGKSIGPRSTSHHIPPLYGYERQTA